MKTPTRVNPERIKAACTRLPSSAKLIDALYRAINQPDVDTDQVVSLVSMDIAITSRLLRMANSACYARGETVISLEQALSWLGAFQAYRVACATVSAKLCDQSLPLYRISADQLFANTMAMAVGMEILSQKAGLDRKTGYTLGLLHNLGRIVLQRLALQMDIPGGAGDLPDRLAVENWERETFGYSQTELGSAVLAIWGMNPLLVQVIKRQYDGDTPTDPLVRRWSALLHLATAVVAGTDFGLGGTREAGPIAEAIIGEAGIAQLDIHPLSEEIYLETKRFCEQSGVVIVSERGHSL